MKAFLTDLALTAIFVAMGMSTHDSSWSDYPLTLVPFVIAMTLTWTVPRVSKDPSSFMAGGIIWVGTTVGGLGLRALFGQGVSGAFPLVTAGVLAVFFFGWRTIVHFISKSSHQGR